MKLVFQIIFLFQCFVVCAQSITIIGFVEDVETGERLINATVFIKNSTTGTFTNNYGFYSLNVKKGDTLTVTASYIGYLSQNKQVVLGENTIINFPLANNNQLDEVTVIGRQKIENRLEIGVLEIPMKQVKAIPTIGAEADLIKAYQLMPGIQSGMEGSSGLYVRGGNPDENLILLDDVPLYYVNHLGGFISIFNTDAINSTKLIKGGFPARYGSRLSSVLDVSMRDGNMKNHKKNFSIGILNTKLSVEGPIKKDTSSFILSLRGLPWEILMRPFTLIATEGISLGYNYYDMNAKFNRKINHKNRIYFSFYKGDDNIVSALKGGNDALQAGKFKSRWGNTMGAFRWNYLFNSIFFSNTIVSYTRYRFLNRFDFQDKEKDNSYFEEFYTDISDLSLKSNFELNLSNKYRMLFGFNSIAHSFNPGMTVFQQSVNSASVNDTSYGYKKLSGMENRLYLENKVKLTSYLSGNIGLHASHYLIGSTNYYSLQPRILLNFLVADYFSVKTSYSQMQQYVHLLTGSVISTPMDIWVPATNTIRPSRSRQFSLGVYKSFQDGLFELSIEGYYKTLKNLIAYKEGTSFYTLNQAWENSIETNGIGKSYGVEFLLQKKEGRLTGWLGYTYAKAERQFSNINQGRAFPFKYDRRHDVSLVGIYRLNEKINFSTAWILGSGYPYTLNVAHYKMHDNFEPLFWNNQIFIFADRNKHRMRAYHRFDFGMNIKKETEKGLRTWTFSIYNAYNRQNPYFYYNKVKNNEVKLYQQSLFPIIPSVSYSLSGDFKLKNKFLKNFLSKRNLQINNAVSFFVEKQYQINSVCK